MNNRLNFKMEKELQKKSSKNRDLLSMLVPEFVLARMEQGQRFMAEEKKEVTILFCDIVDFD